MKTTYEITEELIRAGTFAGLTDMRLVVQYEPGQYWSYSFMTLDKEPWFVDAFTTQAMCAFREFERERAKRK